MNVIVKKCAIYTRKSTEKGLEQEFNTLDAQREACAAYITSQKSEGWIALDEIYDDGGYSGGNLERPALKRLLEDLQAGKVDIIVVYKIDRLTRSLSDFAKLVELFDKHKVSFVSVTQSFNTTTSMGRLTLNVLLSFAQFEREVIGERIRDKVAASKKKGMWMGGGPVHGYDVKDRHLVINEEEAKVIKYIFNQYLELGAISALRDHLKEKGIKTKAWVSRSKRVHPGATYSLSGLGNLLKNPVYAGYIAHKEELYPGLHTAIIPKEKWQKVQERLMKNAPFERGRKLARVKSLLKGKLFDENGVCFTPARGKKEGRQYRYYLNSRYIRKMDTPPGIIRRIPALQIEDMVSNALKEEMQDIVNLSNLLGISMRTSRPTLDRILKNADLLIDPDEVIKKVIINSALVTIVVDSDALVARAEDLLKIKIERQSSGDSYTFHFPFRTERIVKGAMVFQSKKQVQRLELSNRQKGNLAKGILWRDQHFSGKSFLEIARQNSCSRSHVVKLVNKSFTLF